MNFHSLDEEKARIRAERNNLHPEGEHEHDQDDHHGHSHSHGHAYEEDEEEGGQQGVSCHPQ